MAVVRELGPRPVIQVGIHTHAMDNLRYIRETMERAGSFTAVPGWGGVAMGVTALAAGLLAWRQPAPERMLAIWIGAAVLALVIGLLAMRLKSLRAEAPLISTPARKFALGSAPPLLAGALLTVVLLGTGTLDPIPGMWLLLFGAGVVSGGAFRCGQCPPWASASCWPAPSPCSRRRRGETGFSWPASGDFTLCSEF